MSIQEASHLHSIQGEQHLKPDYAPLTEQEADEYVDNHSEEVIDCRSTMRHMFPRPRRGELIFNEIDRDGNFVATYECVRCGCADRREVWIAVRRGKQWRYEMLDYSIRYKKNKKGEVYVLPPGMGRGRPRQFRESAMTAALKGQTPTELRKAIQRGGLGVPE